MTARKILRVEPCRQRRRAYQVAEHHRDLPPLGLGRWPCCRSRHRRLFDNGRWPFAQRCDGFEELTAIANPGDADVLKILHGQFGKYLGVDTVVAKRRLVLLQPQAPQPRRNVHAALPIVEPFSLVGFKLARSAARSVLFHRSLQRPTATAMGAMAESCGEHHCRLRRHPSG